MEPHKILQRIRMLTHIDLPNTVSSTGIRRITTNLIYDGSTIILWYLTTVLQLNTVYSNMLNSRRRKNQRMTQVKMFIHF